MTKGFGTAFAIISFNYLVNGFLNGGADVPPPLFVNNISVALYSHW